MLGHHVHNVSYHAYGSHGIGLILAKPSDRAQRRLKDSLERNIALSTQGLPRGNAVEVQVPVGLCLLGTEYRYQSTSMVAFGITESKVFVVTVVSGVVNVRRAV